MVEQLLIMASLTGALRESPQSKRDSGMTEISMHRIMLRYVEGLEKDPKRSD